MATKSRAQTGPAGIPGEEPAGLGRSLASGHCSAMRLSIASAGDCWQRRLLTPARSKQYQGGDAHVGDQQSHGPNSV